MIQFIQYLQVFFGLLIGTGLMTSLNVYDYQKEKNINWGQAMRAYIKAETGYYVITAFCIIAILFIISDFVDLSITREDLLSKEKLTWKENMRLYLKTVAFAVGFLQQYIAFKFRTVGKKAIDIAADKITNQ